ncbi:MAG: GNAT family N-acetyltransferase [Clostridia bacterium]|nr:GNAT family N-acetyltransferase [Clostridia bacterium]
MEEAVLIKSFDELTLTELHDLLRLRCEVFVFEQSCAYRDIDGLDPISKHVFIKDGGGIAAYARICPEADGVFKIGRVVSKTRGEGLGMRVLRAAVEECTALGAKEIRIEAQVYAVGFYEKAGFAVRGEAFLEDGIPHIEMRLRP